jgi:hypothetical protein
MTHNVEHCRSLGISCSVCRVMLTIKGTDFYCDYKTSLRNKVLLAPQHAG